jgi:hypothetical protein
METETKAETVIPVGDIRIQSGDNAVIFTPTDDMTAKECALIMQMFLNGIGHRQATKIDFGSFIEANNLSRHFSLLKEPE